MIQIYDISSFSHLNNEESISSVSNVVSDKGVKVYNQLYNEALLSMINEKFQSYNSIEEFKQDYIIIDSPQLDYNMPPVSTSIRKRNDITKSINVDLSNYWPSYKYLTGGANEIIMVNEDDVIAHYELISVDYVRNEALMKNKENGISYAVALSKLDKNTPISSDFHRNTFTDIINNG